MITATTAMPTDSASVDWTELRSQLAQAGVEWQPSWQQWLDRLHALLVAGQAQTNLVGDASPAGLASHVVEALVVGQLAAQQLGRSPRRVADIGAGAGLQGLSWSLLWPDAELVLVEPRRKRAEFIAATAEALDMRKVTVVQRSLSVAGLERQLDFASARAVWPLAEWLPFGKPLLTDVGVLGAHVRGPLADWQVQWSDVQRQTPALQRFRLLASAEVPGPRQNVVAILRP